MLFLPQHRRRLHTFLAVCLVVSTVAVVRIGSVARAGTMAVPGSLAESVQKSIGAGNLHDCQIDPNGAVKCWGDNSLGQLGQGNTTSYGSSVVAVSGMSSGFSQVSVGNAHACALKASDGSVWCWGYNRSLGIVGKGVLGANIESTPVKVQRTQLWYTVDLVDVVEIEADSADTCARTSAGEVWCWGDNYAGQLGTGSSTPSASGKAVMTVASGAAGVSVGYMSSCMTTTSGGVKCWGANNNKQIGNAGASTYNNAPTDVTGISSGALAVTVGEDTACVLLVDNVVKCWGNNLFGAVGNGTSGAGTNVTLPTAVAGLPAGIVSIGNGYAETMILTSAGKMYKWGNGSAPTGIALQQWEPITGAKVIGFSVSRTWYTGTCYMLSDSRVFCNGANTTVAPLSPGTPSTPSVTVQAGDGQATVTVSPGTGGGPIDTYTVTATPGGATCTVTPPATSCVISPLTNDTQYTFTAVATNGLGDSSASAGATATPSVPTTTTTAAPTTTTTAPAATTTVAPTRTTVASSNSATTTTVATHAGTTNHSTAGSPGSTSGTTDPSSVVQSLMYAAPSDDPFVSSVHTLSVTDPTVYSGRLPATTTAATALTVLTAFQATVSMINVTTPAVCMAAGVNLVLIDAGTCTAQVVTTGTRAVLRVLSTTVVPDTGATVKVGNRVVVLTPYYFRKATAKMTRKSRARFRKALAVARKASTILITGHSGSRHGYTRTNTKLALNRAYVVSRMYKKKHVKAKISVISAGPRFAVSKSPKKQRFNRRAVVILIP